MTQGQTVSRFHRRKGSAHPPRLVVATDVRLLHRDGEWWSTHPSLSVQTLDRYLALGVPVVLVARQADPSAHASHLLSHQSLQVSEVGLDSKMSGLVSRALTMIRLVWTLPVRRGDMVVLRVPEVVSFFVGYLSLARGAALVSNVVAEPEAISANLPRAFGATGWAYRTATRLLVKRSKGSIYVTEKVLQQDLPPGPDTPWISASNVRLEESDFIEGPKVFGPWDELSPMRVATIGSMETPSKGHDVLIEALARLRAQGYAVRLDLIGDGLLRGELEDLATRLGVSDNLRFHGLVVDRRTLFGILDECHILAMPSRTEGLPRAMIEAMSRQLCVIGSRVGGIVELASEECLFNSEDAVGLADCLANLYSRPDHARTLALRGQGHARNIVANAQSSRVTAFLERILDAGP